MEKIAIGQASTKEGAGVTAVAASITGDAESGAVICLAQASGRKQRPEAEVASIRFINGYTGAAGQTTKERLLAGLEAANEAVGQRKNSEGVSLSAAAIQNKRIEYIAAGNGTIAAWDGNKSVLLRTAPAGSRESGPATGRLEGHQIPAGSFDQGWYNRVQGHNNRVMLGSGPSMVLDEATLKECGTVGLNSQDAAERLVDEIQARNRNRRPESVVIVASGGQV